VPVTVADRAVNRPFVDVVIDAIDAGSDLSDEVKNYVLAALEGPTSGQELPDGVSTARVPEPSANRTVEQPVFAFLTSIGVAGFRGIGPTATLELHPAPSVTVVSGSNGCGKSSFAKGLEFGVTGEGCRRASFLPRQALEELVIGRCVALGVNIERPSKRARLVILWSLDTPEKPDAAAMAWTRLSSACHHHAYELAPAVDEVRHLRGVVAILLEGR
jgi:hypothetical protein